MLKFQNKTVLVTGSGTGIGQAITKKFVENGASAIVLGRRKEPLEETAKMLEVIIKEKQSNATVKIFDGVDVRDEKAVTGMFDSLKSENVNLDVVVNNAGVSGPVTCFAHAPLDQFRSTVDIHLTGTFWTSVQALKVMKEGAKIIPHLFILLLITNPEQQEMLNYVPKSHTPWKILNLKLLY